jgi:hypothetical protein
MTNPIPKSIAMLIEPTGPAPLACQHCRCRPLHFVNWLTGYRVRKPPIRGDPGNDACMYCGTCTREYCWRHGHNVIQRNSPVKFEKLVDKTEKKIKQGILSV